MILKVEVPHDFSLSKEDVQAFFNLFSVSSDKLLFVVKANFKTEKVKRKKVNKDRASMLNSLFKKAKIEEAVVDNNEYTIKVGSKISSFFGEEEISNIKFQLFKHIAYHFGYSECKCTGFTVKDKENKKIQVEEIIYIKSDVNFISPETLNFVKCTKQLQDINKNHKADFMTTSSILYSILSCKEVHFKSGEISYFLKRNDSSFVMYCEEAKSNMFSTIIDSKETQLSDLLKTNFKEAAKYLYKLYIDKDFSGLTVFSKFKKLVEKETDFMWDFLCSVPIFYDNRDHITEKILEIYEELDHKKSTKKKGDYLEVRERRHIENMKFSSLKRYFYT